MDFLTLGLYGFGAIVTFFTALWVMSLRQVVSTNSVHVVQSAKATTSYGKDTGYGNVYYAWPSHFPIIGVTTIRLPTDNFTLNLKDYEAYDKGRLPFMVDIAAFFCITDTNIAAQRISSIESLESQLEQIVQGAVRSILASNEIEDILQGRSTFGEQFTKEIQSQLLEWGVKTVKNLELMDIRDSANNNVIKNIMEKKKSHIEMESRTEVAKNKQKAATAEIEAKREIDLQDQQAKQAVGMRTADSQREVALREQEALQQVKEQEKVTKEKEMSVLKVAATRQAEITKEVEIVKAQQARETSVINADATKQTTLLVAEGNLEATRRYAEGVTLEGSAKAEAEKAMQLAPISAQIELAKEIGSNESYQKYLIELRKLEATELVGMESAKALSKADIKVISNTGSPTSGLNNVMDLFSAKGGLEVGSMLEGLANTDTGKALLAKAGVVAPSKTNGSKNLNN